MVGQLIVRYTEAQSHRAWVISNPSAHSQRPRLSPGLTCDLLSKHHPCPLSDPRFQRDLSVQPQAVKCRGFQKTLERSLLGARWYLRTPFRARELNGGF